MFVIDYKDNNLFINKLFKWMTIEGNTKYDDSVTQFEHSIQTAMLAKKYNAKPCLIAASLFHDIGHLILNENESKKDFLLYDLNHEEIGAKWLEKIFPINVTEPIKLHVCAKRFLCSVEKNYYEKLSFSSKKSLLLQGGLMSDNEQKIFINNKYYSDAIKIRKWDDNAKKDGIIIDSINDFKKEIMSVMNNF
jgi:predicted HD phosphohydrolase